MSRSQSSTPSKPPSEATNPSAEKEKVVRRTGGPSGESPSGPRSARRPSSSGDGGWPFAARLGVSLWAVVHLMAVFVAPWRLSTPNVLPPSYVPVDDQGRVRPDLPPPPPDHPDRLPPPLIEVLYRALVPYMNLAFVHHGYEFFAPDPGAARIIKVTVYDAAGGMLREEEIYPDSKKQWPRLFYHRHMMLGDQAFDLGRSALEKYGAYLQRKYGASRVRLEYFFHHQLTPQQVLKGDLLNATFTYERIDSVEVVAQANPPSSGAAVAPGAPVTAPPPRLPAGERLPGVSP